jgi:non-ribosomal peptide synthase protein (TIGR01720 family)
MKTTSYQEWAERLAAYARSSEHLEELNYWNGIEESTSSALPRLQAVTVYQKGASQTATIRLTPDATGQLLKEVHQAYNTEINDLLLAALALAVTEWTGEAKMLVNLEGHGREEMLADVDITRTIGWFTSIYPVILQLGESTDLASVIKRTKETLRAIPNKGVGYGILKYLTPEELKPGMAGNVQPEMSFNYLGQFDGDVNTEFFTLAEIAKGEDQSPEGERFHALDFVGVVKEGVFELAVEYDTQAFDPQTMEGLLERYRTHLLAVITHCVEQEETEYTLSDFTDHLNEDEVQDILSELGDLFE